jgi:hypothetical protein
MASLQEDLMRRLDNLDAERERTLRRLDLISSYGEDVYEEGAVIRFDHVFGSSPGTQYMYAAIKSSDGYWRTTGPNSQAKAWSWAELTSWIATGLGDNTIWMVEGYVRVTR